MKTSVLRNLVGLVLVAAPAMGQNTSFLEGLVTALQATNLNISATLAIALSLNATSQGAAVISDMASGAPYLVFAPTNQACE